MRRPANGSAETLAMLRGLMWVCQEFGSFQCVVQSVPERIAVNSLFFLEGSS